MKWYLAKLVYQIIYGEGNPTPQFDEQLRLLFAEDELHAFHKARATGHREEDHYLNNFQKPALWKFIDVSELHPLTEMVDGAEVYSRIFEEKTPENFIKCTQQQATCILENSMQSWLPSN